MILDGARDARYLTPHQIRYLSMLPAPISHLRKQGKRWQLSVDALIRMGLARRRGEIIERTEKGDVALAWVRAEI